MCEKTKGVHRGSQVSIDPSKQTARIKQLTLDELGVPAWFVKQAGGSIVIALIIKQ